MTPSPSTSDSSARASGELGISKRSRLAARLVDDSPNTRTRVKYRMAGSSDSSNRSAIVVLSIGSSGSRFVTIPILTSRLLRFVDPNPFVFRPRPSVEASRGPPGETGASSSNHRPTHQGPGSFRRIIPICRCVRPRTSGGCEMRMTPRASWGVGIALLVIVLAGSGGGAATRGGALTVGLDQDPPTIDPHASPSAVTYQIISSVTENLLYQGTDGKIVPWLATDTKVSPDGKSFTFSLRKDVKFTDGAPLNAAAVKWNFDRIVDPNFKAGGALVALTGYTGSKVIDEYTVQVNFKGAYAPFLSYAAGGTLSLVSPKTTPTQGDAVNQKPVGSGPYVVVEYAQKDHITIARDAGYNRRPPWSDHQGPPYLDRIVFKIIPEPGTRVATIESGETQMINALNAPAAVLGRLERNKNLRVERVPYPGAPRIWMLNVTAPPTDDLRVRQALNFGVNRAAFVESVYKGLGQAAVVRRQLSLRDQWPGDVPAVHRLGRAVRALRLGHRAHQLQLVVLLQPRGGQADHRGQGGVRPGEAAGDLPQTREDPCRAGG